MFAYWYGKSLCFAVLPHLFDYLRSHGSSNGTSILICVVPLQPLMSDQHQWFKKCLSVAVISTDIEHVTLESAQWRSCTDLYKPRVSSSKCEI